MKDISIIGSIVQLSNNIATPHSSMVSIGTIKDSSIIELQKEIAELKEQVKILLQWKTSQELNALE